jgi:hypothetical protein
MVKMSLKLVFGEREDGFLFSLLHLHVALLASCLHDWATLNSMADTTINLKMLNPMSRYGHFHHHQ